MADLQNWLMYNYYNFRSILFRLGVTIDYFITEYVDPFFKFIAIMYYMYLVDYYVFNSIIAEGLLSVFIATYLVWFFFEYDDELQDYIFFHLYFDDNHVNGVVNNILCILFFFKKTYAILNRVYNEILSYENVIAMDLFLVFFVYLPILFIFYISLNEILFVTGYIQFIVIY